MGAALSPDISNTVLLLQSTIKYISGTAWPPPPRTAPPTTLLQPHSWRNFLGLPQALTPASLQKRGNYNFCYTRMSLAASSKRPSSSPPVEKAYPMTLNCFIDVIVQ